MTYREKMESMGFCASYIDMCLQTYTYSFIDEIIAEGL